MQCFKYCKMSEREIFSLSHSYTYSSTTGVLPHKLEAFHSRINFEGHSSKVAKLKFGNIDTVIGGEFQSYLGRCKLLAYNTHERQIQLQD